MKLFQAITTQPFMNRQLLMSFLLVITLISCSEPTNANVSTLEENFSKLIPVADMNRSLQLVVDEESPSFQPSHINLMIYNKSPYFVSFDGETHIRLLGSQDRLHWDDVKNGITYSGTMQLSPKGTILLDLTNTAVKPVLDPSVFNSNNSDILLRIVLVGEIIKDDTPTGQELGAFVDVVLKP